MDEASVAALREAKRTPGCVWPGCDTPHLMIRVGALCWEHAELVADAVNESRVPVATRAKANAAIRRRNEAEGRARRAASRGQQPGWVYYLRIGDRVKIGYSVDVKERMRAYPPGSHLLAVHPGTKQLETEMHQRFAGSRAAGREWFRETPDLTEHIGQVLEQFGEPRGHRYNFRTDKPTMGFARPA